LPRQNWRRVDEVVVVLSVVLVTKSEVLVGAAGSIFDVVAFAVFVTDVTAADVVSLSIVEVPAITGDVVVVSVAVMVVPDVVVVVVAVTAAVVDVAEAAIVVAVVSIEVDELVDVEEVVVAVCDEVVIVRVVVVTVVTVEKLSDSDVEAALVVELVTPIHEVVVEVRVLRWEQLAMICASFRAWPWKYSCLSVSQ